MWRKASTTLPVPASPSIGSCRTLADATQSLAEVGGTAHERHVERKLSMWWVSSAEEDLDSSM